MCFSAPASLAASGALAIGGIATLRLQKRKADIPLSLFPIIFAAHQLTEGILWLSLTGVISDTYRAGAIYAYAFIAFVLWPIFVPFSMYMIETGRMRRKIILLCQLAGLYIGIACLVGMIRHPVEATMMSSSITYHVTAPPMALAPYLIAVSIPFLVASNKRLAILGFALLVACGTAAYMSCCNTFPSLWCFYAAILSLIVYLYFRYEAKAAKKNKEQQLQHST
ncbi:MAG: DUF6629 family protein [Dehalococcoidia bacterium]